MATAEDIISLDDQATAKKAADLDAARLADAQAIKSSGLKDTLDKVINDALLASDAPNKEMYDAKTGRLFRGQPGANAPVVTVPPLSSTITVDDGAVPPTDGPAPVPSPDPSPAPASPTGLTRTMGGATVVNSPG